MKQLNNWKLWTICSLILLTSCNSDEEVIPSEPSPATLIEATEIFTRPSGDLRAFLSLSGLDVDLDALENDVTTYQVTYETDYKGEQIIASAIVLLPVSESVVSTVSFQHGTIASDAEAPTNLALGDNQIILASALSSAGNVVVLPDFIGFGSSVEIMHPYYLEDLTATSVLDAIYAAREVADEAAVKMDNELYLAGYSQGGYATMATHKWIEEKGMDFFELKASFPSSGGYDVKLFQEYFFSLDTYHQPFFLAYVAYAYKETLDWDESLNDFFQEPFASEIPAYFDGSLTGGQINAQLNDTLSVLLKPEFISDIDEADYQFIADAFVENSLTDWTPQIRMFMYHGDADITVPYANSVSVYNQLIANGASESIVTFEALPEGTHATGISPYIEHLVTELQKLEQ